MLMIKKWNDFIREFVENDNYIDVKMQEIKDLIGNVTDGNNIIYEWENKNDHAVSVSFSTDNLSIRYDFDIDDLYVIKTAGGVVDFEEGVDSIDHGLEMIEKDIQSILGISERILNNYKMINRYNDFLVEKLFNEILSINESFYLKGSREFLDKLKTLSEVGGKVGLISKTIYDKFGEWIDDRSDRNFYDVTTKDDTITFIKNDRIGYYDVDDDPSYPYEKSGRTEIKVGRIIRSFCELFDISVNAKEIEDFVNHFKASVDDSGLEFKLVRGRDISTYYKSINYRNSLGTLGSSCMAEVKRPFFSIYSKNDNVQLLIYVDSSDKITGRAIVWKLSKSPCGAEYLMDRVYTNNDSDVLKFKKYAIDNGWMYKRNMNCQIDNNVEFLYNNEDVLGEVCVELNAGEFSKYPWIDTLCFLSKGKNILSNIPNRKSYLLHSTMGSCERCDGCGGLVIDDDGNICEECGQGIELLKDEGIVVKIGKIII